MFLYNIIWVNLGWFTHFCVNIYIITNFFVYLYTTYLYKEYNILYYYDIEYKGREE